MISRRPERVEVEAETCNSGSCDDVPTVTVFWPGKSPPPRCCLTCAEKLHGVAEAMGLTIHMEPYAAAC